MNELTKLERVELALMDAAQKARREGKTIICGSHYEIINCSIRACCPIVALGLSRRMGTEQTRRSLSRLGVSSNQRLAFVAGFDGWPPDNEPDSDRPWFAMGRRLRRALKPVSLVGAA